MLLLLCCCLLLVACQEPPLTATDIVQKAYAAHGKAKWDAISSLQYEKSSVVYAADGSIRLQNVQQHHYQIRPNFSAVIQWEADSAHHEIRYQEEQAQKWVNGERVEAASVEASSYNSVNAARYTVSQPFKLTDPGVVLTYEGIDELEEGEEVHVIKASYSTDNENHTQNDEWWYYFDRESFLCLATMVHHGTTYSYIKNLEYDRSTGIVFNHHRKGYAVDSARNILYHQSEYFYTRYKID